MNLKDVHICHHCFVKFKPIFKHFKFEGCSALAIYEYDDFIRSLIYQFKTNLDIALGPLFLERYLHLIYFYLGYKIALAPSHVSHDLERGFRPVEEIFKVLGLPLINLFIKTNEVKQVELSVEERKEVSKYIKLKENFNLKNQKILLVDDIMTTGSTLKAMVEILKEENVKKIKILVVAKTPLIEK